ncbi:serine/threonine-protein kinase [Streptomyces sp. enrichment culture]|uniref:serine/threonine-protein kinase n=1 Tax=Streptomyces sp. enrichment culture TaxID=1795815 RepID=UPI003F5663B1
MGRAHVSTHESVGGRFRLVEVLHRETNRVCWYADDTRSGRPCLATRTGLPEGTSDDTARRALSRVLRTTESVDRLAPGRVATVVDALDEDGSLWTVTAWIDGVPLGQLLAEQGTFNPVRAARIGLELLDVLDAAHAQGITHGELSPGQVFVRDTGPVVVAGYGLAGATPAPRLTAPSYASPEQARDERVGPAADLWALGALLYTMVEGRPPFRDRGRHEATLRGVDRLPLRSPVRAGPLTRVVQGLLRKDARERLTRQVVREALTRVLSEEPGAGPAAEAGRVRLRGVGFAVVRRTGRDVSRRTAVLGAALAVLTVTVAVLAATQAAPGGPSAAPPPAAPPAATSAPPSAPAAPPSPGGNPEGGGRDTAAPATPPDAAEPSPSGTGGLPPGFRVLRAPEGFSVALPAGWERLSTTPGADGAYRARFGADGDPRTLAVTYSERVGPDPVAVWRDDVEPGLKRIAGYERIGAIRALTYQGRSAADMEWYATAGGTRTRTLGRGFLLGGGRSFSLRWTAPAADWDEPAGQEALGTVLRTFRPGTG